MTQFTSWAHRDAAIPLSVLITDQRGFPIDAVTVITVKAVSCTWCGSIATDEPVFEGNVNLRTVLRFKKMI